MVSSRSVTSSVVVIWFKRAAPRVYGMLAAGRFAAWVALPCGPIQAGPAFSRIVVASGGCPWSSSTAGVGATYSRCPHPRLFRRAAPVVRGS